MKAELFHIQFSNLKSMKLSKIDLINVLAVGHSNGELGLLIDRGSEVEFIEIAA